MKMVFMLTCSAAMFCNFAQGQDTTLAKIDKKESTLTKNAATEMNAPVLNVDEVPTEKKSESTFTLPDYSGKKSILNNKVGPNGEELFMKKNRYYYIDSDGKKVKAKKASLSNKPKSS